MCRVGNLILLMKKTYTLSQESLVYTATTNNPQILHKMQQKFFYSSKVYGMSRQCTSASVLHVLAQHSSLIQSVTLPNQHMHWQLLWWGKVGWKVENEYLNASTLNWHMRPLLIFHWPKLFAGPQVISRRWDMCSSHVPGEYSRIGD